MNEEIIHVHHLLGMIKHSILMSVISLVIGKLSTEVAAYHSLPIYKPVQRRPVNLQIYEPMDAVYSRTNSNCFTYNNGWLDAYVYSNYNSMITSNGPLNTFTKAYSKPQKKQQDDHSEKSSAKLLNFRDDQVSLLQEIIPKSSELITTKLMNDQETYENSRSNEQFLSTPEFSTNNDLPPSNLPLDLLKTKLSMKLKLPSTKKYLLETNLPSINDDLLETNLPSINDDLLATNLPSNDDLLITTFPSTNGDLPATTFPSTNDDLLATKPPTNDDLLATTLPSTNVDLPATTLPSTNDDLLAKNLPPTNKKATTLPSTNDDLLTTNLWPTNVDLLATNLPFTSSTIREKNITSFSAIKESLDQFERTFYNVTFMKLLTSSADERKENGISFATSGLFIYMILLSLASEVDRETRSEIENVTRFPFSDSDYSNVIKEIVSTLPLPNEALKFSWSSRLVHSSLNISKSFKSGPASALSLHVDSINTNELPGNIANILNKLVEIDSGGTMHNTFEEQDVSEGVRAVVLNTVYVRARWRAAPTLLNDSRSFYDAEGSPPRTTRMIRINDIMGYVNLTEWNAEMLQIAYATPGLSLVVLVPYGRSLRALAAHAARTGVDDLLRGLRTRRVAVTLPLYTLRMTLLLPKKLQAMGMSRLLNTTDNTNSDNLRISHAVQRLMFWSEAGRNAFKDDGIEWDEPPEQEIIVDRPYVFYVRWHNITIMSGNFVL